MSAINRSAARAAAFLALLGGGTAAYCYLMNEPVDVSQLVVVAGVLLVDLLISGWRRSSLGRLLQPGNVSTGADLFFGAMVFSGLFLFVIVVMSFGLNVAFDAALQHLHWQRPQIDLPLVVGIPLMFMLRALTGYAVHRLLHTRWLWPLHAVHHAPREMTVLNTVRIHPLEDLVRMAFGTLPGLLYGLDPVSSVALSRFGMIMVFWQHSNIPNPFPWIERWLISGPITHRIHHARAEHLRDRNFAICPLIDRLFGTYAWTDEAVEMGIDDPRYATGNPMTEMVSAQWRWMKSMWPSRRLAGTATAGAA